jgi:hypothetical protein
MNPRESAATGWTRVSLAGHARESGEVQHVDLELRLAPYCVSAVPRRTRSGLIWHPARTGEGSDVHPVEIDLRLDVRATHIPQRTRSGLMWVSARP